jgi:hypothetical protein
MSNNTSQKTVAPHLDSRREMQAGDAFTTTLPHPLCGSATFVWLNKRPKIHSQGTCASDHADGGPPGGVYRQDEMDGASLTTAAAARARPRPFHPTADERQTLLGMGLSESEIAELTLVSLAHREELNQLVRVKYGLEAAPTQPEED